MALAVPTPSLPDVAEQSLVFLDPDGVSHVLTTDNDLEVAFGVEGRGMPPVQSVVERVAGQPGGRRRQTTFGVREVVLPLELLSGSQSSLRTRLRELIRAFDPTRGDGVLRSTATDGSVREITCRYSSGMELVETESLIGNLQAAAAVFTAVDPFWYDGAVTALTVSPTVAAFFPILPLRLSGSEVYADVTVVNDGDVETWPEWTITGPGFGPVLRNLTTGQSLDLSGVTIAAGESVEIDTRPGRKSVTTGLGDNLFGDMTPTSVLWPLREGSNSLRVEVSDSTGDTNVTVRYRRRWLSA